jgi:protocatechuate 3,4-dioxygenase beta subunit
MNELGENIHRPAHIHVKTWIPENRGSPTLVTQLYFEGDQYMDEFVKKQLI